MNTVYHVIKDTSSSDAKAALSEAGRILREGGLVVFPTETVYGLGANALDADAASKIYSAKGRPSDNPLIVHIADPADTEMFTDTPYLFYRLARSFMPGPLTVIMPKKKIVPHTVTAGLDTVAIRCPSHAVANALIKAAGVPIAAPSANLSGSPSPTTAAHVCDDMMGRVDMIIDGGACEVGLESTIVKIEDESTVLLLRPGAITKEDLEALGIKVNIASSVLGALKDGEKVLSPGMKYRHYAPKAPLYLLDGDDEKRRNFLADKKERVAYLAYEEEIDKLSSLSLALYCIGAREDIKTQAGRLFSLLREVDKENYTAIYASLPRLDGMGMALYNRMIRAAAHQIIQL